MRKHLRALCLQIQSNQKKRNPEATLHQDRHEIAQMEVEIRMVRVCLNNQQQFPVKNTKLQNLTSRAKVEPTKMISQIMYEKT